jgi:hypothetical protein
VATGGGGGFVDVVEGRSAQVGTINAYLTPQQPDMTWANGEVLNTYPMKVSLGTALPAGEGDTPRAWGLQAFNEVDTSRTLEVWVVCQA